MRSFFLLFAIFISTLFSSVSVKHDFGEIGNTHEIAEESIKDQFESSLKRFDGEKRKEEFVRGISNVSISKTNLSGCEQNSTRVFEPGIILKQNYYTPDGRILAKEGEKINPLKNLPIKGVFPRLVVFNGEDDVHVEFARSACLNKRCVLFTSSGNAMKLSESKNMEIYPIPKPMIESVGVKCVLSVVDVKGESLEVAEFNMNKKDKR